MSSSANSHAWTATGQEPQVFLDPSGRRARLLRPVAATLAAIVLCGQLALVAGATGFSALPSVARVVGSMPRPTVAVGPGGLRPEVAARPVHRGGWSEHRRSPSPLRRTIVAWTSSTNRPHQPGSAPAFAAGS
jgi:hypothetical protein